MIMENLDKILSGLSALLDKHFVTLLGFIIVISLFVRIIKNIIEED